MSHSAPAADGDGAREHSSDTTWELVALPPITYHVKNSALPSKGDDCAFSPNNDGASPPSANAASTAASTTTTRTRKRKRPVCLTLPAAVGREFLVRSTLSACDRCNVVGRKRIKRGGKDAAAAAAADITSTLCQRCQNIYNGGKYLSKHMARFDLVTASTTEEGRGGMEGGTTIRLSALGSNAVAIQINKIPICVNQQGTAEAIVKQGDVVSFLLNPRGVREEKDCAAATAAGTSRSFDTHHGGKQSTEEEFWSMRFSVVQSKCVGKGDDQSDSPAERRKSRPKESEPVLDPANCAGNTCTEEKKNGGVSESAKCDPKDPRLSDHDDDKHEHEELDETPILSMHHFSATQWQNQSAMDITSMVADTPSYDEDDDDDDDSESGTSPALGGKANDSPAAKKGFGGDQDSNDEDNGRNLSSFSLQELKKLRDRFNTSAGVTIAANAAGADPTPSNADEISASFHRALFSMVIRREEKSTVHVDVGAAEEDRTVQTAARAKPGASEEEDDDEGGNGHTGTDKLCDQEILLPKLLEYTTIVE